MKLEKDEEEQEEEEKKHEKGVEDVMSLTPTKGNCIPLARLPSLVYNTQCVQYSGGFSVMCVRMIFFFYFFVCSYFLLRTAHMSQASVP